MQTIKLQLEDSIYETLLKNKINIQDKFQEFLSDLLDDGYPSISAQEAKKRVAQALEEYKKNPQNFSKIEGDFWNDTEQRLLHKDS